MDEYIKEMRKLIGHKPLMIVGCGALIENEKGEILLQQKTDSSMWGTPGGGMLFGETFVETATREVFEETGLNVTGLSLFGIYSGKDNIMTYPNGDVCFGALIVFTTNKYSGELVADGVEGKALRFFGREELPQNIVKPDRTWIEQWSAGEKAVFIG